MEDHRGPAESSRASLEGGIRWETRRYIQAAFNRRGASPWVLIAQSQVGREGLNLHEACRVVVQFHAEWNRQFWSSESAEWIGRQEEACGRRWRKHGSIETRRDNRHSSRSASLFSKAPTTPISGTVSCDASMCSTRAFWALLPADAWSRVPADRVAELQSAAPSFRPPNPRVQSQSSLCSSERSSPPGRETFLAICCALPQGASPRGAHKVAESAGCHTGVGHGDLLAARVGLILPCPSVLPASVREGRLPRGRRPWAAPRGQEDCVAQGVGRCERTSQGHTRHRGNGDEDELDRRPLPSLASPASVKRSLSTPSCLG